MLGGGNVEAPPAVNGGGGGANGNAVFPPLPPPVDESPATESSVKKVRRSSAAKPGSYGCIFSDSEDNDDDEDEDELELEDESEEEEQQPEEEEEEEEEGSDHEIDAGDGDGDGDGEEEEEEEDEESMDKLKLAEGFYLIEAVRGKRIRRGKREYRIKWRGWPESENTWEPMENLKTVPHVIAAYEESLRTKRSRKRKRKNSYTFSQTKKRTQRCSSASAAVKVNVSAAAAAPPLNIAEEETIPAPAAATEEETIPAAVTPAAAEEEETIPAVVAVDDTEMPDIEVSGENPYENGVDLGSPEGNEGGADIGDNDVVVGQTQVEPQEEAQLTRENGVANGSERADESVEEEAVLMEAGRNTSSNTGARRRKSGPVRRYKFEPNNSSADVENHGLNNGVFTGLNVDQLPENLDSTSRDVGSRDNRDVRTNICDIIEILKPVKFSKFTANNSVEVCLNFIVRNSDGKIMTVDNKFLKAHYPVMLVNYYEQRIRY